MVCKPLPFLRAGAVGVVIVAAVASRAALALGQGYGVVAWASAAQAAAVGIILWRAWPRARWAGPGVAAALLGALAVGSAWSARSGVLALWGVAHLLLYAALLAAFARSLLPGRESLVTAVARRVNPGFHAGMVPYTRGVTAAWCGLFAGELAASAALLAWAPQRWGQFVTSLHALPVVALMLAEVLLRRWRWRHEHASGLFETVRGIRKAWRQT